VTATFFYTFSEGAARFVPTNVQVDLAFGILILFVMLILYQAEKTRAMKPVLN
jgi:hypothetical protein